MSETVRGSRTSVDVGGSGSEFWTLVGPDSSGKSTVLDLLHREHGWRVVSYDDEYLDAYPLIRQLRERWVDDAFVWSGRRYSSELVLSALHPIVLHLRDEIARSAGPAPVIVDSYYYKLLAKCTLLGLHHEPTFDIWRSFPQPAGVFWLEVPPALAWRRSGRGDRLNPFEHYGTVPGRAGFTRLQGDLRATVLAEVGDVPVIRVDGRRTPEVLVAVIRRAVERAAKP
jgi:thymidylate kinase